MNEYFLCLTPYGPVRAGAVKPKGDYLDTLSYLPGSVLRGALAEWLKVQGRESQIPQIVQHTRFGNFFPSVDANAYALPFPFSALECKLERGFRNARNLRKRGHGIRDTLLLAVAYTALEQLGARFPVPFLLRCSGEDKGCRGRMEKVSGFYVRLPEGWEKVEVARGVQTKVALSRYRRAAQEQMLYRVVGIRPNHVFVGRIWVDDPQVKDLLVEAVQNIGVGALTTRGFGAADLREVSPVLPSLRERLQAFNARLREIWLDLVDLARQVGYRGPYEPHGTYFSIDLLAPAILRDQHGLPTLRLRLRLKETWLEPVWWAVQPVFTGGFSTAWGLPKPTALGAAMGSAYVFRTEAPAEQLLPELESLEVQGIGERTGEGFGEILVCHPFHQEVVPV